MRILVSGAFNPRFRALPDYLATSFRQLGHEVALFDHRRFLLPGRLRARLPLLDRLDHGALNARFLNRVRRFEPDLVVVNQGMVLTTRSIDAVRARGARCINWFSDYPAEFDVGMQAAPAYDAFYLGSSHAVRLHRAAGHRHAGWLPFGCDPSEHHPGPPLVSAAGAAVVFVGSYYPERHALLRFLHGLPVGIWGPGWERAAGDPHLAGMIRGGSLRPDQWRALYAGSAAAINIHYGSFGPREVSGDLVNTRVFEILACGACQVVDRPGDLRRLFRDGEHLLCFADGGELRQRVEEALADENLRRRLAAAGREAVMARHTYRHRADHLIDQASVGTDLGPPATDPAATAHPMPARSVGGGIL